MFTFILFIFMSAVCFGIYIYLSNKIVLIRKQNILLSNQNNELRKKLNRALKYQNTVDNKTIKVLDTEFTEVNEDE